MPLPYRACAKFKQLYKLKFTTQRLICENSRKVRYFMV